MMVLNTTVISNFLKIDKMELLNELNVVTTKDVLEEIKAGMEKGILPRKEIRIRIMEPKNREVLP